jgi:hypothetical protein
VSLEAKQSLNNALIQNAQFQAARQTLGLSQEEMLFAVARNLERQDMDNLPLVPNERYNPNRPISDRNKPLRPDVLDTDSFLQKIAGSGSTVGRDIGVPEIDGAKFQDDSEYDAGFGRDQSQFYEYQDTDSQYDDQQRKRIKEDLLDAKEYKGSRSKKGLIADLSAELALNPEDFPVMAPKTVLTSALSDLQRSADQQQRGIGGSIARVFGGSGVDSETSTAIDALKVYLGNERAKDAGIGRATASNDRARFDPEVMEYNDFRADAEAQNIARTGFLGGKDGAMADEAIGRIGEIRSLGAAGSLGEMEQTQVIRQGPRQTFPNAEEIVDGSGRIVGYADPVTKAPIALDPALGISLATQGANTPDAAQMMNAPQNPQTAREWTESNLPSMVQDNRNTPPRYPQANIAKETTNYSTGLAKVLSSLGMKSGTNPNVRNIEEIDRAAHAVQAALEKRGKTLMIQNPDEATRAKVKNIPAGTQLISGLMQRLGMTSGDEQRLANSMFQLDAAKRSSVNQNPTGTYLARENTAIQQPQINLSPESYKGVSPATAQALVENEKRKRRNVEFNSPSEGFGSIPIAQQRKGSSVKGTREDITAAFKKLQSSGASKPYIAMPEERSSSPLSSFSQDQVYNNTGETDPAAIRETLERRNAGRGKKGESAADRAVRLARNESNIIGAQAVQRRADEAEAKRKSAQLEIMRYLPTSRRRITGA